jgi:pyridoxine kinase
MSYKKILTIQDISCVGQCSLTVALPILSACGLETCVLPSAVLSTHTAGFSGYTFRDLTEDMPAIKDHWVKEGIKFEAIYTGYLGSTRQIEYVADIFAATASETCVKVVDPAMADNGKLYPGFDGEFVEAMKGLCAKADYIVPNITESCFLTGLEYKTEYDKAYIDAHLRTLTALGCKNIILTGVSYRPGKTGIEVVENGVRRYYEHDLQPNSCHGTGDVYASAFTGAYMQGFTTYEAAKIAADYVVQSMKNTIGDDTHWYGVKFETAIPDLIKALNL